MRPADVRNKVQIIKVRVIGHRPIQRSKNLQDYSLTHSFRSKHTTNSTNQPPAPDTTRGRRGSNGAKTRKNTFLFSQQAPKRGTPPNQIIQFNQSTMTMKTTTTTTRTTTPILLGVLMALLVSLVSSQVGEQVQTQDYTLSVSTSVPCDTLLTTHRFSGTCCALNVTVGGGCVLTVTNGNCKINGQEWTLDWTSVFDSDGAVCPGSEYAPDGVVFPTMAPVAPPTNGDSDSASTTSLASVTILLLAAGILAVAV